MIESIARSIRQGIIENDGITVEDLSRLISNNLGPINLYPSDQKGPCCPLAMFFSLQGFIAKGNGHKKFSSMLNEIYKHLNNNCYGITNHVIFIFNEWQITKFEQSKPWIDTFKNRGVKFDFYFIGPEPDVYRIQI